jgi:hypothetical protein
MEILEFQQNTHLVAVYYNKGKSNLFRIHINVTLIGLKYLLSQLNVRLHFHDDKRVTNVEYHYPPVSSYRTVLFTNMKLQNDGDV